MKKYVFVFIVDAVSNFYNKMLLILNDCALMIVFSLINKCK